MIALAEELIEEQPFVDRRMKISSLMGSIMAMMLNGSLDWNEGCKVRNYIEKEKLKEKEQDSE